MANKIPIKDASGIETEFASTDTIPTNNLGTGTANNTKVLRGDQSWTQVDQTTMITGATPIANGGTGATTAQAARSGLSIDDYQILSYQALGAPILAQSVGIGIDRITTSTNTANQVFSVTPVWVPFSMTLTGIGWYQVTKGTLVAANENRIGLYSYSGGTLNLVASSTDDATIWNTYGPNQFGFKNFSGTYAAVTGLYYIGYLNCASSGTYPAFGSVVVVSNAAVQGQPASNPLFTNSAKMGTSTVGSITTLPTSKAMSLLAASTANEWWYLY